MIKKYEAIVKEITNETPQIYIMRLKIKEPKDFSFKAGQYILIDLTDKQGNLIRSRAYSIASPPHVKNYTELCIKRIDGGLMSNYLCDLKVGDTLHFKGPMGSFILPDSIENDLVFVATGTGVAPFRSMLYKLIHDKFDKEIWLFFGERTQQDLFYRDEFEKLASTHKNFHFIPVLSREEWAGEVGYVQNCLKKHLKYSVKKEAFVCGLQDMVYQVSEVLLNMGFPDELVRREKY